MSTVHDITQSEIAQVHVESSPTVLTGTPTANKKVFDAYSDLIAEKFNAFADYAENTYSKSSEAYAQIGHLLFPVGTVVTNTTDTNPATYLSFGTWIKLGNFEITVQRKGEDNSIQTLYFWERFE